jgi:hypothetical protein
MNFKDYIIFILLNIVFLNAADIKVNAIYNKEKVVADITKPESCVNNFCHNYGDCYIFENQKIFDKNLRIKLPLEEYKKIGDECIFTLYHAIKKVKKIDDKEIIQFANTSIGAFTEFEIEKDGNILKLIQIRQIGRSFVEDNALALKFKNFENYEINETLDFIKLQKILSYTKEFDCKYANDIDDGIQQCIQNYMNNNVKTILPKKQPLYSSPNVKTKMYLIKGDKVEILEEKDDWYYILYHGKKDIKAWIPKSAVEETIQNKEKQNKPKPISQNIQPKPNIQKEEKTFFSKLLEWFGINQHNKNMSLMVS